MDAPPGLDGGGGVAEHDAQPEPVAVLDDVELADVGIRGEGGELERVDGDAAEAQNVVAAAVHGADAPQRPTAGAGLGVDGDDLGDLVADQRLERVEEVRQQHARTGLAVRHRPVVLVDVLDDGELLEEVEAVVLRALRRPESLGLRVEVERAHAERLVDAASHAGGQQLAAARDDAEGDPQAAGALLVGEQRRVGGVGVQHIGLVVVEGRDDPRERQRYGERREADEPERRAGHRDLGARVLGIASGDHPDAEAPVAPHRHARERGDPQELGHVGAPTGRVVGEDAGPAARPAGAHDAVAAAVRLGGGRAREVRPERVAAQTRVADDVVEALHQRGLVERGQRADLDGRPGCGQSVAVVGRARPSMGHECAQSPLLQPLDCRARDALARAQGARLFNAARGPHAPGRGRLHPGRGTRMEPEALLSGSAPSGSGTRSCSSRAARSCRASAASRHHPTGRTGSAPARTPARRST